MSLKSRTRSDYRFFLPYRTRWSDNDQYGHLNNSIYSFLIDSIVNTYLIQHCALKPTTTSSSSSSSSSSASAGASPIGLVISSHCSYFSSLEFPAVIDLGLRVNKIGTSSVVYEVGFFEEGREAVSAAGGFVHVFVGKADRRPVKALDSETRVGLEKIMVLEEEQKNSKL